MRPSSNRHVFAILRKILALNQSAFAEVAGCSISTVQAIELGRLKLSESLAIKVEIATGVSRQWLLTNDLTAPPFTIEKQPYSRQGYERHQAQKTDLVQIGLSIVERANLPGLLFSSYEVLRLAMIQAIKDGRQSLALYQLSEFLEAFRKEFTGEESPYVPSYNDRTIQLIEDDLKTTKGYIRARSIPEIDMIGAMLSDFYVAPTEETADRG